MAGEKAAVMGAEDALEYSVTVNSRDEADIIFLKLKECTNVRT